MQCRYRPQVMCRPPKLVALACLTHSLVVIMGYGVLANEPPQFAIRNVRIERVSAPAIESGTVVVEKGLIKAVGVNPPIPAYAWVIDGKGLVLYPGLIDALTELAMPPAAASKVPAGSERAGVQVSGGPEDRPETTPWRLASEEIDSNDKRIETWREAGFTTVLTVPRGRILAGQGALINLGGQGRREMVVRSPLSLPLSFQAGDDAFSFPSSLMGVLSYITQVFSDAAWSQEADRLYEAHPRNVQRPPYDQSSRVIGRVIRDRELVLVPANNAVQILRALDLIQESGLHAALYGCQQGYQVADVLASRKVAALVSLKWPERGKETDPEASDSLRSLRFRDRATSTPAVLSQAGVKFAFYSDGMSNPKDILKNAKRAVDAGLSTEAAVRAFTLSAAEILGVEDRLGSIEPGKIANLLLVDGDLFSEKTKIRAVFVDGRRFEVPQRESSQEQLN